MSLLHHHSLVKNQRLTPELLASNNGAINNVSSFTVTYGTTPTEGNLMLIWVGGIQTRTPSSLTGYTQVILFPAGGGTDVYYWKIATSSEGASIGGTLSGNLQGNWVYMEWKNADNVSSMFHGAVQDNSGGVTVAAFDFPAFAVIKPSVWVMRINLGAASNSWVPTNNFVPITPNASNIIFKMSYRRYHFVDASEVAGYTSSNSRTCFGGVIGIAGKLVA